MHSDPAHSSGCLVPDPILTRNVAPAFEAAFEKAKASGAMNPPLVPTIVQGPGVGPRVVEPLGARLGLPATPRQNSMVVSRFVSSGDHIVPGTQPVEVAAPSSTTPVKPPNSLSREFNGLVQKLPRENRDLLQTIVELLALSTVHAKTTKMPLSNLLLIFCPCVSIIPSVFRVMVQNHEAIFDQALLPPAPASEHPSEDSDVYEAVNLSNTTSQPTPPEVPIMATPLNTIALAPSIVDPTPEDVVNSEGEIRAPSNVECKPPSIRELVSTGITATETQDHAPTQGLDPRTSLGINEVGDVVERQSTSPLSPTDPPPQQEEDLDAATLAEPHVVAPPRLAPPREGRLSDDWAASVLKAATASP